jgi:hypothetical protein
MNSSGSNSVASPLPHYSRIHCSCVSCCDRLIDPLDEARRLCAASEFCNGLTFIDFQRIGAVLQEQLRHGNPRSRHGRVQEWLTACEVRVRAAIEQPHGNVDVIAFDGNLEKRLATCCERVQAAIEQDVDNVLLAVLDRYLQTSLALMRHKHVGARLVQPQEAICSRQRRGHHDDR